MNEYYKEKMGCCISQIKKHGLDTSVYIKAPVLLALLALASGEPVPPIKIELGNGHIVVYVQPDLDGIVYVEQEKVE